MHFHGLGTLELIYVLVCFIQKVDGRPYDATDLRAEENPTRLIVSTENNDLEQTEQNKGMLSTTEDIHKEDKFRRRRNAETDTGIAQQKDNEDERKQKLKSMVTQYAFGNPSLPGSSNQNKNKTPRRPTDKGNA